MISSILFSFSVRYVHLFYYCLLNIRWVFGLVTLQKIMFRLKLFTLFTCLGYSLLLVNSTVSTHHRPRPLSPTLNWKKICFFFHIFFYFVKRNRYRRNKNERNPQPPILYKRMALAVKKVFTAQFFYIFF